MKKKCKLIFLLGYLLFAVYLFLINFHNIDIYSIIGILTAIVSIFIIYKNKSKNISKKYFYAIIFIALIVRITLPFLQYTNISDDYGFYYNSAINLSKGLPLDNNYIGLFPYLYPFIQILGNIMKLFGESYVVFIIFNMVIELIGAYFLCCLSEENFAKLKLLTVYLINPFNILWITKCCPVILVNTLIIIIVYIFKKIEKGNNLKKTIIYSLILGLLLSITNSLRPVMIIFIISLIIWIFIKLLKKDKYNLNKIFALLIVILIYFATNIAINYGISKQMNITVPKNISGWSIYVGSNYESNGTWNQTDSNHLYEIYEKNDNVETHKLLQKEGIDRYKELGIKSIFLILKKSVILGNDVEFYTYNETMNSIMVNNTFIKIIIRVLLSIYWYLLLISNMLISYSNFKERNYNYLIPSAIFGLGLFIANLLVEVSPRYFMPVMTSLMIYILYSKKHSKKSENIANK